QPNSVHRTRCRAKSFGATLMKKTKQKATEREIVSLFEDHLKPIGFNVGRADKYYTALGPNGCRMYFHEKKNRIIWHPFRPHKGITFKTRGIKPFLKILKEAGPKEDK